MSKKVGQFEESISETQRELCVKYGAEYVAAPGKSKLGFATGTEGQLPINGLRHPVSGDTNGWYIWCGEHYSDRADFFAPLHTCHVYEDLPEVAKLLGLPPGYRFLSAGDYLDVWFDASLLQV